jgi:hypothetical protein
VAVNLGPISSNRDLHSANADQALNVEPKEYQVTQGIASAKGISPFMRKTEASNSV